MCRENPDTVRFDCDFSYLSLKIAAYKSARLRGHRLAGVGSAVEDSERRCAAARAEAEELRAQLAQFSKVSSLIHRCGYYCFHGVHGFHDLHCFPFFVSTHTLVRGHAYALPPLCPALVPTFPFLLLRGWPDDR